jgi:hypothetical protein
LTDAFTLSKHRGVPPAGGGSNPETVTITGTILGVVFGLIFVVALCAAIWFFVVTRRRKEVREGVDEGYETEVETEGEFSFEADEQLDSCDGGTNFDQDENEFIDQGFEANLFGRDAEEGEFQF